MDTADDLKIQLDQYINGPIGGHALHSDWPMLHKLHKKISHFLGGLASQQAVTHDAQSCAVCGGIRNQEELTVCQKCGDMIPRR